MMRTPFPAAAGLQSADSQDMPWLESITTPGADAAAANQVQGIVVYPVQYQPPPAPITGGGGGGSGGSGGPGGGPAPTSSQIPDWVEAQAQAYADTHLAIEPGVNQNDPTTAGLIHHRRWRRSPTPMARPCGPSATTA
jgi:hypothetical protein